MDFDISVFRASFPEFGDTARYPNSLIEFWSGLAVLQVRECVWKRAWIQGVSLYTAHELVLAGGNIKVSSVGGTPGQTGGIANNKTVGDATIGYDTVSTAEKDAGYWNLSNYGKQFIRLARIFGAVAIQL